MTQNVKGRLTRGDPARCMVMGCNKKAIYQNAGSRRCLHTTRGYCAAHRAFAIEGAASIEARTNSLAERIDE